MKQIQEKYESYQVSEEVKETILDPYLLVINIESVVQELEKTELSVQRRIIRDNLFFLGKNNLLKERIDCLNRIIDTTEETMNCLVEILEIVDEKNFVELIKLVDFIIYNYAANMAYFNSLLNSIDAARRGISMVDYSREFTHPRVMKFVESKINSLKKAKELEK